MNWVLDVFMSKFNMREHVTLHWCQGSIVLQDH